MKKAYADVKAFYDKFKLPRAALPLQLEPSRLTFRLVRLHEEVSEFGEKARKGDLAGALQELCDVMYFAAGTAVEMGLPLPEAWTAVHAANMRKARPTNKSVRYGEFFDVVKPSDWTSPEQEIKDLVSWPYDLLLKRPGDARISLDETMLCVAEALAQRAACRKRRVGCVFTNAAGKIVGTGYNGRVHGEPNCAGRDACSGPCEGIHAETNALQGCIEPMTCYVTTAPCWHCLKSMANIPTMRRIVTRTLDTWEPASQSLWVEKLSRSIDVLTGEPHE